MSKPIKNLITKAYADQFAGGLDFDGQIAVGHGGDAVCGALCAVEYTCQTTAPRGHHGQGALTLGICRRGQSGGCGCGTAQSGSFQKRTTIH